MSDALVWLRRDLRLADNPALTLALAAHERVVPVYVHAPEEEGGWPPGAASRWWLHHSLGALDAGLRARGSRLVLRRGPSAAALAAVARESGAGAVYWARRYEPDARASDARTEAALTAAGLACERAGGALLFEPDAVSTGAGQPFRVFTPFWRACLARLPQDAPLPAPGALPSVPRRVTSLDLPDLGLLPRPRWDAGLAATWVPGEEAAAARIERFLEEGVTRYAGARDLPAEPGTSRLSPHLHFGEVSPRQALWALRTRSGGSGLGPGPEAFLRELGWREFAHHVLYHFPHTPEAPLDPRFAAFPWRTGGEALLAAWQRGHTGIPLVDAGLRELWTTGWMHNRVRMVAASFLTKHLRVSWEAGARWFWDTLVDADLANNTLGWQWVAGCGADAAPYFRVFNPARQGERFDPHGTYVRRWVPELERLPARWVHRPWQAPPDALAGAGVDLGRGYPAPLVDLDAGRQEALAAYRALVADQSRPALRSRSRA
jgi:deoxyribodipyrimidine photo-lyase